MAWAAGHKHAENILKQSHIQVNFNKIFSNPRIDMLHPLPDGKFPGVCDSLDCSMPLPKARTNAVPIERLNIDEDTLGDNKITTAEILDDLPDLLQYFEEPNELMGGEDPEKEDETASDWLSVDGFQIHMSSAIWCLFTSDLSKKSQDHRLRVRHHTRSGLLPQKDSTDSDESLVSVSLFMLGDPFMALIRTGKAIALAVMQTTMIEQKGKKVSSVSEAKLFLEASDIKVSGQVLNLIKASSNTIHGSNASSSSLLLSPSPVSNDGGQTLSLSGPSRNMTSQMIWTGNYIQFKNMNRKADAPGVSTLSDAVLHKNNLVVMAPSYLIQPIGCHNIGELDLSQSDWETINNGGLTCTQSFNLLVLSMATQQLLETAKSKRVFPGFQQLV